MKKTVKSTKTTHTAAKTAGKVTEKAAEKVTEKAAELKETAQKAAEATEAAAAPTGITDKGLGLIAAALVTSAPDASFGSGASFVTAARLNVKLAALPQSLNCFVTLSSASVDA